MPQEQALSCDPQLGVLLMDSLSSQVAVLDSNGVIEAVNRAWLDFERKANQDPPLESVGQNYLAICDAAQGEGAEEARAVAYGIRGVLGGEMAEFAMEYPCHSPSKRRWFNVRVVRFRGSGPIKLLMTHENITNVKMAQESLAKSEAALRQKSQMLEEANTALKVLLRQRDQDRQELEDKVNARVAGLVLPFVERLQGSNLDSGQQAWLEILRNNLMEIVSPFAQRLSSKLLNLTPASCRWPTWSSRAAPARKLRT
jgi:hypothetical protein